MYRERDRKNNRIQREENTDTDIIFGRNSVTEALRSGLAINKILVSENAAGSSASNIVAMAAEKGIVLSRVSSSKIDELTGTDSNQGVMAYISPLQYCQPEDILAKAREKGEDPFVIILDEIQDPHNLGAIIRTAETA